MHIDIRSMMLLEQMFKHLYAKIILMWRTCDAICDVVIHSLTP